MAQTTHAAISNLQQFTDLTLALSGDAMALRLCIERLLPKKADRAATVIMPDLSTVETTKIIPELLKSLAGQELSISDIKSLTDFFTEHDNAVHNQSKTQEKLELNTMDPNEAARAYAQFMRRE